MLHRVVSFSVNFPREMLQLEDLLQANEDDDHEGCGYVKSSEARWVRWLLVVAEELRRDDLSCSVADKYHDLFLLLRGLQKDERDLPYATCCLLCEASDLELSVSSCTPTGVTANWSYVDSHWTQPGSSPFRK